MNDFIAACFRIQEFEANKTFDPKPHRAILDKWMAGQGPAHMFVYY